MTGEINMSRSSHFAVIDTETNWHDEVMSIGIVISDSLTFRPIGTKYYLIDPEYRSGGMYSNVISVPNLSVDMCGSREAVMANLAQGLKSCNVKGIFAYNAKFDYGHLPELSSFQWYDIMRLAAYRQYNHAIPESADCCMTGRLKRNYGVEPIMRMLSGKKSYCEIHNAVCDAIDELELMRLLGHPLDVYECAKIN